MNLEISWQIFKKHKYFFCTSSLPSRNSLCQNFTCVFDSADSPYYARNLRQISLGPTFSLVRNFITTRCAIVTGTSLSLILISRNWGEGRVWRRGEEGPHTPSHLRTRSLPNRAHSLVATDRGRFIFDLPTYQISWKFVQWKPSCSMRMERRTDRRTEGETDMTKLIVPFRNYANAPKHWLFEVKWRFSVVSYKVKLMPCLKVILVLSLCQSLCLPACLPVCQFVCNLSACLPVCNLASGLNIMEISHRIWNG